MAKLGRTPWLTLALYSNATAVAVVGLVWLNKPNAPNFLPAAYGQQAPQPIAGGAGLFLMPAQLASNTWGCYVMDVDRQTLMVYQYQIGSDTTGPGRQLKLVAARDFSNDRRLRQFNTDPPPGDIKKLTDAEDQKTRAPAP